MSEILVPTGWLSDLMLHQALKVQYAPETERLIGSKLDILPQAVLEAEEYPRIACVSFGTKAFTTEQIGDILRPASIHHLPDHGDLYKMIPAALRLVTDDFTLAERGKYALRKTIRIGNEDYYAYYGLRIEGDQIAIHREKRSVVNGVVTTTNYSPDANVLNPVAPTVDAENVNITNGVQFGAVASVTLNFTEAVTAELRNVGNILFGNPRGAYISEIMLCSGVDRTVVIQTTSGNSNFKELGVVEAAAFVSTIFDPVLHAQGQTLSLRLSSMQPMYHTEVVESPVVTDYTTT